MPQTAVRRPHPLHDTTSENCSSQATQEAGSSRTHHHGDTRDDGSIAEGSRSVRSSNTDADAKTHKTLRQPPQFIRKKHEEFLLAARASSAFVTSATGTKPTSPELFPCNSPGGTVTPLTLTEAGDYFTGEVPLAAMAPAVRSDIVSTRRLCAGERSQSMGW